MIIFRFHCAVDS